MEKMAETVSGSHYQRLHHMLSESSWDRSGVRRQLIVDANTHFGYASALVLDESGFAKKGDMSAGVARQWNGRLGKTDNSQVGLFAAVTREGVSALIDGELYLPEHWVADTPRCEAAGVPEGTEFRTKGEMALAMIHRLRREGLHFAYTVFDAGYGHLPWLLTALDDEREVFLAEAHSDQTIYLTDPCPIIPERRSAKGKAPTLLAAQVDPMKASQWAAAQPASAWRRMTMRDHCRVSDTARLVVGWRSSQGALLASSGAPGTGRGEVEVLLVERKAQCFFETAGVDAGRAAFRRACL
jgi:SRSO17 transposase